MEFKGTAYVGWREIDFDGNLTWCPAPDPTRRRVEWLRDAFVEKEMSGVRWAMEAWVSSVHSTDHQMLLVEAESLSVIER